ncbi:MarR family transcriptional regulator [Streptomyces varsoviensis]|uniref:MarR family winged helix-turn-helix transcriptional regulator n=1 Tax=Streptomyces varsoviensis TaxID=67373 RepID=UPI0033EA2EC5
MTDSDGGATDPGRARPPYPAAEIAAAWRRERPGAPTQSIEIVTPIWWLGKLFTDDRARALRAAGIDAATLDLLSVLRRGGPPYTLTTREIANRTLVTAGAVSQRVARAESQGFVERTAERRSPGQTGRTAVRVTLTAAGHELIEQSVAEVLNREARLVDGLSAAERETLAGLLDKLLRQVGERTANGGDGPRG